MFDVLQARDDDDDDDDDDDERLSDARQQSPAARRTWSEFCAGRSRRAMRRGTFRSGRDELWLPGAPCFVWARGDAEATRTEDKTPARRQEASNVVFDEFPSKGRARRATGGAMRGTRTARPRRAATPARRASSW